MRVRPVSIFNQKVAINPGTIVKLTQFDASTPVWKKDVGRHFMVGFYSADDGIDCIWLVNEQGQYEQTVDRRSLLHYFNVVHESSLDDFFGRRAQLPAWPKPVQSSVRKRAAKTAVA